MIDTTTFDGLSPELVLRGALARIAGMTGEEARRGTTGVLAAVLADINETAEAALAEVRDREAFAIEEADYVAWRATQPAPTAAVADELPL